MSITPLAKVTFYGFLEDKEEVLTDLQDMGCVHLLPLRQAAETTEVVGPSPAIRNALKFLLSCPERRHQILNPANFDPRRVEVRALEIQTRTQYLTNERDHLLHQIDQLTPWGDFKVPLPDDFGGLQIWFYIIPHYQIKDIQQSTMVWKEINKDNRFRYVVIVGSNEPLNIPGQKVIIGNKSLSELSSRLEEVEVELEDLQAERVALTRWLTLFIRSINQLEDLAALASAGRETHDSDPIFAVQGWAQTVKVPQLRSYSEKKRLALTIEEPAPEDAPPTLLKNPDPIAGGQDLVSFYMTPSYRMWDPSSVVFFSFAVFFAIIMSDAGYAALLGIILVPFWTRMGHSDIGKRLRALFAVLIGTSLLWGILAGGYFGFSPPPGNILAPLKVLDIQDAETMMPLSIIIGAAHIILANLGAAWIHRKSLRALAPIGWAVILVGGCTLWLGTQGMISEAFVGGGPWIMGVGFLLVLFFSSSKSSALKRLLDGLTALTSVTKAFGDVLSYLRLFALGLASASLALAFNDLAHQVAGSISGFGMFLALLILLVGHGINFVLAIMGGFVHGLRLNYIEFFNWGLPEEGTVFRPFAKKQV
jgi:V/A-type H+-transporting ATPase subunit I